MAAGHRTSGMKRNPKRHGKPSGFSGLRIVASAAAITVVILFFAFGAVGLLMMARAPQESIAGKLDTNPPVFAQEQSPAIVPPAPEPVVAAVEEPLVIPATEPVPFATQQELEQEEAALPSQIVAEAQPDSDAVPEPESEPETTASVPEPPAMEQPEAQAKPQPVIVPRKQRVRRYTPPRQQRVVRRTYKKKAEPESTNPLMQLFGVR
jgi:hypothetical protein